uniref:ubiquitinyl hydrolase 1 n=1 Tax=Eptatretus burgeri TaxID=7764 RepID=A0A8C4R5L2_EPTBU
MRSETRNLVTSSHTAKMPIFTVSVKWGKEKLQGVPVDTESPPWVFKSQLSELTGVSPHRQRVLIRGVALKGSTLLLMGSVEELPNAPAERPMFVEDFSEAHLANVMDLPTGLVNLGNTCYLNATVQCLRKVPELREALKRYKGSVQTTAIANQAESITAALRDLFDSLERDAQAVPPITLLQLLHLACPQFAQEEDGGEYMLQDARECWQELMNRLTKLPSWEDHKEDVSNVFVNLFVSPITMGLSKSLLCCSQEPTFRSKVTKGRFVKR